MKDINEQYIKNLLIRTVGKETFDKLTKEQLLILDESVDGIISGKFSIDDRKPNSDSEILLIISKHFEVGSSSLDSLLKAFFLAEPQLDSVKINYRNEELVYHKKSLDF